MTKCLDLDQVGSFDVADKLFKEDINDFGTKKTVICEDGTRVS